MQNNQQNPYGNNTPYGNGKNHWDNNGLAQQRQLEREREQRGYKKDAELGFDEIVATVKYAEHNQTEVFINEANKSAVVRYFKRYWDNRFLGLAFLIMLFVGILSFYSKVASFGILAVVVFKYLYSQSNYCRYFLNDHSVSKNEIKEIESIIFGYKLNLFKMFIIASILTFISFIVSFFSVNIFIEPLHNIELIKFLSRFAEFQANNELYSYVNMFFILILITLKTIEKWKK